MNEIIGDIESKIISPIEGLKLLQAESQYLFHGTAHGGVIIFEPRQALNNNNQTADGPPAVFASSMPEIAIFIALTAGRGRKTSYVGRRYPGDEEVSFYATADVLDNMADSKNHGYVHFFDRILFSNFRGHEYTSLKVVKSIGCIKVTNVDMTEVINLIT